jgi:hypothetical protein
MTFGVIGEVIPGLTLYGKPAPYPVVNERAVRAGAGVGFLLGLGAFLPALLAGEFIYLKVLLPFLLFDFLAKTVLGLRWSPLSRIGDLIVFNQTPDYVGAVQKRFAWSIGLMLAMVMSVLIFGFGYIGIINLIICGICLTFMFMESAFGICVGCVMYGHLLKYGAIKAPEYKPVCPGNVCAIE